MSGINENGFKVKRLPEIKQQLEDAINQALGTDIDFSPDTPDGQISALLSSTYADIWELAQHVYDSQYPDSASGVNLDRTVSLNNLVRLDATKTTVSCIVEGELNSVIPANSEVRNIDTQDIYTNPNPLILNTSSVNNFAVSITEVEEGSYSVTIGDDEYEYTAASSDTAIQIAQELFDLIDVDHDITRINEQLIIFITNAPKNISTNGNIDIDYVGAELLFEALTTGRQLAPANSITEIVTPVAGWLSVVNKEDGTPGRDKETDAELRARRRESIGITATGTLDAIVANLRQLEGVISVTARENSGTEVDGDGIEPQHIWLIVDGGDEQQIADTIYQVKAGGIGTRGNQNINVTSEITGNIYTINFDRPTLINTYITMDISTIGQEFPANGVSLIQADLVEYFNNLRAGDTLYYSRLFSVVNNTPGFFINDLFVDITSTPTATNNITTALNEKLFITNADIIINVNT